MDSENPKRPEGSHDQQGSQPSDSGNGGNTPQGQPMGGYSPPPPPASHSYSQPQQPQQPQYGQSYEDRPATQPDQPPHPPQPPYGDQQQYPPQQPYGQGYQNQQPYYNQPPPPSQVNVAPKKSNNGMLFGLIGLVVLAVAGTAIWFFAFNKPGTNPLNPNPNPDSGGSVMSAREISAASTLPSNTLGYIAIATNLEGGQKAAFDKIRETFEAQPGYKETMDKLMQQATGSSGASGPANQMVQEIQGLITKYTKQISIAVLPPSTADWQAMKDGGQAAMMDVATRNVVAVADMDLAKLKTDANSSEVAETSNGVEISRIVSGTLVLYAAPLGGSNVAVGLRAEPVRAIIDQSKNAAGSVRETETYKYLSGSVPGDRVASFYLNLTDLYNQIETVSPGMLKQSGIEGMTGGFLMTVSGQDGGVQLDFASQADIKSSLTSTQIAMTAKPDAATISDIPADSVAFLASTDLKTLIKASLDSMSAASKQAGGPDMVAQAEQQVQQMTGLSLQNDIIPLLGGDYALSMAAGDQSMPASSVVFQLKLNGGDRDKAANVVDKLMQAAGGGPPIPSFDAAGGKFYDLGSMMGSSQLGLVAGVGKDRMYVVYTPDQNTRAKLEDVSNNLGKGFGTGPKWDEARKHLPNDSNAVIYVDTESLMNIFGANAPSEAQTFLKPFKYVIIGSAASASANKGVLRIFFGINK